MSALITVVIPTRNRSSELGRLLAELGTVPDCELIVVDDASDEPDARTNLILVDAMPRARLLRNLVRAGGAAARNRGATSASGTYLWFVDDDDVLPRATLESAMARLQATNVDLAMLSSKFIHGEELLGGYEPSPERDNFQKYRDRGQLVSLPCIIMRRDLFSAVGGWDDRIVAGQDTDLILRIAAVVAPECWPDLHVLIDVGDRPRVTTNIRNQQRGKLQMLRKHWYTLTIRRRLYYIVTFICCVPLLKHLSARRVAREIELRMKVQK